MRVRTLLLLAAGMTLFGSATPLARMVTASMPPLVAATLRIAMAAVVLYPAALWNGFRWSSLDKGDWVRASALALVGMFGFTVMLAYGMTRVPGVTGSIVMGTGPAVTALVAVLFLGEQPSWRRWVAIVLSVAGVILMRITSEATDFDLIGVGLVFGAVVGEATYTLVGKRLMTRHDPVATAMMATVLSLPLFVASASFQVGSVEWSEHGWKQWSALVSWGIGTLALGSIVWYMGVREVDGHVAAPFMGLMPVSALVLSYLLLGEDPSWWHLPGFALVLAAIGLVAWDQWQDRDHAEGDASEVSGSERP